MTLLLSFFFLICLFIRPAFAGNRCRNIDMVVGECKLLSECESQYYEKGHCYGAQYCCLPAPSCGSNGGRCRRSSTCTGSKKSGLCLGLAPEDVVCCENENPIIPADAARLDPIMPEANPPASQTKPGDAWLQGPTLGGFPFEIKNRVSQSSSAGGYVHAVNKIVLHTVEGRWPNYGDYEAATNTLDSRRVWSHFVVAADFTGTVKILQYLPMDKPSFSLEGKTDLDGNIQIEIGGIAYKPFTEYDVLLTEGVRTLVQEIRKAFPDIPNVVAPGRVFAPCFTCAAGYSSSYRFSTRADWQAAAGILGHQHVWRNSHWDPGPIDPNPILCLQPWCGQAPPDLRSNPGATRAPSPPTAPVDVLTPAPTPASDSGTGGDLLGKCLKLPSLNVCVAPLTLRAPDHSGQGAWRIATDHGTSLQDFYLFNPSAATEGVFLGRTYYVNCPTDGGCSAEVDAPSPPPTPAPTTLFGADGNCFLLNNEWCVQRYTLVSPKDNGKGPYGIAGDHGMTLAQFYMFNDEVAQTETVAIGETYLIKCTVADACSAVIQPTAAPTEPQPQPQPQPPAPNSAGPAGQPTVMNNNNAGNEVPGNTTDASSLPDWLWPVVGFGICFLMIVAAGVLLGLRYLYLRKNQKKGTRRSSGRRSSSSRLHRSSSHRNYSSRVANRGRAIERNASQISMMQLNQSASSLAASTDDREVMPPPPDWYQRESSSGKIKAKDQQFYQQQPQQQQYEPIIQKPVQHHQELPSPKKFY